MTRLLPAVTAKTVPVQGWPILASLSPKAMMIRLRAVTMILRGTRLIEPGKCSSFPDFFDARLILM